MTRVSSSSRALSAQEQSRSRSSPLSSPPADPPMMTPRRASPSQRAATASGLRSLALTLSLIAFVVISSLVNFVEAAPNAATTSPRGAFVRSSLSSSTLAERQAGVPASTPPTTSSDFTGLTTMGAQKTIGLILAIGSSLAIGTSFIITKRGLMDAAERGGMQNASEGHSYLSNPIWWAGMVTMIVGEVANFAAYMFAPPILVTPLGALSVLIGSVLASFILKEELGRLGRVGCTLCLVGTVIIVVNAPEDKEVQTVDEILNYALQTPFLTYCFLSFVFVVWMIWRMVPRYGKKTPLVYLSICSLSGSITVMAVKGFGVALKLTVDGNNQFTHPSTYCFAIVVVVCILVQMNYFNKALDQFSTNIVNPIYYVTFTTSTIFASFLLFRGFNTNGAAPAVSLLGGFVVIFMGVYLLNMNRLIDPVTQQPRMSIMTGEGISGTGRLSESHERVGLMNRHHREDGRVSMGGRSTGGGGRSSMSLADQYWAAAATGGSSSGAAGGSHSRRSSNGSVLFNAYEDLGGSGEGDDGASGARHPHHVLGQLDEEDSDSADREAFSMSPLSPRQPAHGRTASKGTAGGSHHRRSASLKSVVGPNGKVIPGGGGGAGAGGPASPVIGNGNGSATAAASGAAALLGAVKK